MNESTRKTIVRRVRELRVERHWTQSKLADLLGLSQSRYSEIEGGKGSITAEQFLTILKTFNVPVDYFSGQKEKEADEEDLQKTLSWLGASHLGENPHILPSERIKKALDAIRETVATAQSPRLITALAPVIVRHCDPAVLNRLRYQLYELGFLHRYGWVLENTLRGVQWRFHGKHSDIPEPLKQLYQRAERVLSGLLELPNFRIHASQKSDVWGVDQGIVSDQTYREVRKSLDAVSKKWGIVTRIRTQDFIAALDHAQ